MFYIILLILIGFAYFFLMPKDVRRSMDIFFFVGIAVLVVAFAVAQASKHQTFLLELLGIIALFIVTLRAWREIGRLKSRKKRK